jgi:hypothetical protein
MALFKYERGKVYGMLKEAPKVVQSGRQIAIPPRSFLPPGPRQGGGAGSG